MRKISKNLATTKKAKEKMRGGNIPLPTGIFVTQPQTLPTLRPLVWRKRSSGLLTWRFISSIFCETHYGIERQGKDPLWRLLCSWSLVWQEVIGAFSTHICGCSVLCREENALWNHSNHFSNFFTSATQKWWEVQGSGWRWVRGSA